MISVNDVYTLLSSYSDVEDATEEQLLPCCQDGLNWVLKRLRETADEDDPLITETAAAIAHFYFFVRRLTEMDKYESYKVGDMTISQNPQKQYLTEKELRHQAIANAAPILKDGGFYFRGN
ncbi:MAG: hypothetical protein IJ491_00205 [Clostridia bacterium]|nr:hypothetical protein [Clostridia bacterium]